MCRVYSRFEKHEPFHRANVTQILFLNIKLKVSSATILVSYIGL